MKRKRKKLRPFDIINIFILGGFALLIILPFVHILFASISDPNYVRSAKGLILFPYQATFKGYQMVFQNKGVFRSILNSVFYMVAGTTINMVLSLMGAYVLSRKNLPYRKVLMIFITIPMFFGAGVIPLYLLLNNLSMINTIWAILLPGAISPWNMIILKNAFDTVPDEVIESAKVEGAGHFYIFTKVCIPLIKPTIAIITLYYAVYHWNDWFLAMAFVQDRDWYPLQLIVRELLVINDTSQLVPGGMTNIETLNYGCLIKYSTTIVSMIPMMLLYPLVQKYFTKGILVGSIK